MKVQIRQSFGIPPNAPFQVGEVLDVTPEQAQPWLDEGLAVRDGSILDYVNYPAAPALRAEHAVVTNRRIREKR